MKKADELKVLVMGYWRFIRNCPIVAMEYEYGAADVLSVTPEGMVIETEVKVSVADMKREAKKPKHRDMQGGSSRWHYFYFAVPQALEDKAKAIIEETYPYAGLLVVKPIDPEVNPCYSPPVQSARQARLFTTSQELTQKETMKVVKGMATTLCQLGIKLMQQEKKK